MMNPHQKSNHIFTISPRIIIGMILVALVLALTSLAPGARAAGTAGPAPAAAQAPAAFSSGGTINFQGELTDSAGGIPVADGDYKMRFAIYDADNSGNKKWPTGSYEEQTLTVTNGLFNAHLGAVESGIDDAFTDGNDRYLQVWVCTTAGAGCSTFDDLGRLPISSVGYAQSLIPGASISNSTGDGLFVETTKSSDYATALYAKASGSSGATVALLGLNESASNDSVGVWGQHSSALNSNTGYGVLGQTFSQNSDSVGVKGTATDGIGVYGSSTSRYGLYATSSSNHGIVGVAGDLGTGSGVYGTSESNVGTGVYGISEYIGVQGHGGILDTRENFGIYGTSDSSIGYGVFGSAPITGTMGLATAENGTGLVGYSYASTGSGHGVFAETNAPSGTGVYGQANATSGAPIGVLGTTKSTSTHAYGPAGVEGWSIATTGGGYGVIGRSDSNAGIGIYGVATAATGGTYGIKGYTDSSAATSAGVAGFAQAGVAIYAHSTSGNPIEAYGTSFSDVEFKVSNTGDVTADGTFTSPAADFAEMLPAVDGLEPTDVLVINLEGQLAQSSVAFQPTVVGVYSTKPGFLGGQADDADLTGKVPLAVVGVVPVKASADNGPIQPGDMLVASNIPGHAMWAGENSPNGTVIGKALEPLAADTGVILMLVILQ
jgi:hypothetical protein